MIKRILPTNKSKLRIETPWILEPVAGISLRFLIDVEEVGQTISRSHTDYKIEYMQSI